MVWGIVSRAYALSWAALHRGRVHPCLKSKRAMLIQAYALLTGAIIHDRAVTPIDIIGTQARLADGWAERHSGRRFRRGKRAVLLAGLERLAWVRIILMRDERRGAVCSQSVREAEALGRAGEIVIRGRRRGARRRGDG